MLAPETIGLIRAAIAESRRFPDLASSVHRMTRERGSEAMAQLLGELAESGELHALPAFTPERMRETARRFTDLTLLPMLLRALFGENLDALRDEIDPHVSQAVAFFLAACRNEAQRA